MYSQVQSLIEKHKVKWIDLRFTNTQGKEQHVTIPSSEINNDFFTDGKMFDGSSIAGWKGIHDSDMILMPDSASAVMDPFHDVPTLNLRCDIIEPRTMQGYGRDPRSVAKRAESYLKSTGIGDAALFGPEPEFFVFDDVKWKVDISGSFYEINSEEAAWSSSKSFLHGNKGHRPYVKEGYFPVPPVDSMHTLRASMCHFMEKMGLNVEVHHHEVGTGGQCEIGTKFNTLMLKADEIQIQKYCIHNVANQYGKTATFMPKPLVGDNGNGMHVHISLLKNGKNIFAGEGYAGLSETALFYIGGIIKHAKALNAFTNASTNSYKRLVPGFEAPVLLAYSARNRSAAIRIPFTASSKSRRVEIRFPDPTGNPYLIFSAILMAGLDGIKNHLHPGEPADKDLYDLPPVELANINQVSSSLDEALNALEEDNHFLTAGEVFTEDMIKAYLELKRHECVQVNSNTHPIEFELYYSC